MLPPGPVVFKRAGLEFGFASFALSGKLRAADNRLEFKIGTGRGWWRRDGRGGFNFDDVSLLDGNLVCPKATA